MVINFLHNGVLIFKTWDESYTNNHTCYFSSQCKRTAHRLTKIYQRLTNQQKTNRQEK